MGAEHEPHFRMLETIYEYASDKLDELGETEMMRRRHAEYFWLSPNAASL